MKNITLLDFVLQELESRKGNWPAIAKAMTLAPKNPTGDEWKIYYSWMSKLTQEGVINDPGVKKIQALADYFRAHPLKKEAA